MTTMGAKSSCPVVELLSGHLQLLGCCIVAFRADETITSKLGLAPSWPGGGFQHEYLMSWEESRFAANARLKFFKCSPTGRRRREGCDKIGRQIINAGESG